MTKHILIPTILSCLLALLSSCTMVITGEGSKSLSFGENLHDMKVAMMKTQYAEVIDSTIISDTKVREFGAGTIRKVVYSYGLETRTRYFYVDADGKNVHIDYAGGKIEDMYKRDNGYPASYTYYLTISNEGKVVVDWMTIIILAVVIGVLLFLFEEYGLD